MLLKVEGGQFVKNTENNALLTVDQSAIKQNEARRMLASKLNKNEEINNLKSKVDSLTNDISEIKQMLQSLMNHKG
jgi:hypothetical protein